MTHPLHLFTHCPRCGATPFLPHDERSCRCIHCGFTFYLNASAATAALIFNTQGQLLVVRRALDPGRGMLDLPGGFCDLGETAEHGLRREVREETGLELAQLRYLFSQPNNYVYSGLTIPTMDLFYLCTIDVQDNKFPQAHAMDDAHEVLWLKPQDIIPEDFAFESTRIALRKFLQNPNI